MYRYIYKTLWYRFWSLWFFNLFRVMSKVGYQVLGGLTSFFAFTSVIASSYIICGAIRVRRSLINKPAKNRPLFVIQHVLFMSICDVFTQTWLGVVWLPIGFDGNWNANWSWFTCSLWGSFGQFFLVASASWYLHQYVVKYDVSSMISMQELHHCSVSIENASSHTNVWIGTRNKVSSYICMVCITHLLHCAMDRKCLWIYPEYWIAIWFCWFWMYVFCIEVYM